MRYLRQAPLTPGRGPGPWGGPSGGGAQEQSSRGPTRPSCSPRSPQAQAGWLLPVLPPRSHGCAVLPSSPAEPRGDPCSPGWAGAWGQQPGAGRELSNQVTDQKGPDRRPGREQDRVVGSWPEPLPSAPYPEDPQGPEQPSSGPSEEEAPQAAETSSGESVERNALHHSRGQTGVSSLGPLVRKQIRGGSPEP